MDKPSNDPCPRFALLALERAVITPRQFSAAFVAWMADTSADIADILAQQGALSPDARTAVDALVRDEWSANADEATRTFTGPLALAGLLEHAGPSLDESGRNLVPPSTLHDRHAVGFRSESSETIQTARFSVLSSHAKGGLGEVFLARDEEFGREVALKEIQKDLADNPNCRVRFLREAELTGGLEHPGIVPVYARGSHPDGRPYYTMRFIRGETLRVAIERMHRSLKPRTREFRLELRRLLAQLITVCNALEYAHSRGVLHRDVKPSNIMLGKFGETFLVDWGLAKAMGRSEDHADTDEKTLRPVTDAGSAETLAGSALGTPGYMSPEQAAGRFDAMGPTSDVYGVGATLYAVLTGRPPIDGGSADALQRIQLGAIPSPRSTHPWVPRSLEAICLKALALSPANRYPSCALLAADIEHYLADEPVAARPDGLSARIGRWTRRHRSWAAAMAIVLLVAVGTLSVSAAMLRTKQNQTDLARREEHAARIAEQKAKRHAVDRAAAAEAATVEADNARQHAQKSAASAQLVSDFLAGLLQSTDPFHVSGQSSLFLTGKAGADVTLRDILDRASARLGEFRNQPETESRLALIMGDVYRSLGDFEKARPLLSQSLESRRQLAASPLETADSLHALAKLHLDLREFSLALPLLDETLQLRLPILGDNDLASLDAMLDVAWANASLDRRDDAQKWINRLNAAVAARNGRNVPEVGFTLNLIAGDVAPIFRFTVINGVRLFLRLQPETMNRVVGLIRQFGVAFALGRDDAKVKALQQLQQELQQVLGKGNWIEPYIILKLGDLSTDPEAIHFLAEQCMSTSEAAFGRNHPFHFFLVHRCAGLLADVGDTDEVDSLYRMLKDNRDHPFAQTYSETKIEYHCAAASFYFSNNRVDEALDLVKDLPRLHAEHPERSVAMTTDCFLQVAAELVEHGRSDLAEPFLAAAFDCAARCRIRAVSHGPTTPRERNPFMQGLVDMVVPPALNSSREDALDALLERAKVRYKNAGVQGLEDLLEELAHTLPDFFEKDWQRSPWAVMVAFARTQRERQQFDLARDMLQRALLHMGEGGPFAHDEAHAAYELALTESAAGGAVRATPAVELAFDRLNRLRNDKTKDPWVAAAFARLYWLQDRIEDARREIEVCHAQLSKGEKTVFDRDKVMLDHYRVCLDGGDERQIEKSTALLRPAVKRNPPAIDSLWSDLHDRLAEPIGMAQAKSAVELTRERMKVQGETCPTLRLHAVALYRAKQYRQAIDVFEKAAAMCTQKGHVESLAYLAMAQKQTGDDGKAKVAIEKLHAFAAAAKPGPIARRVAEEATALVGR